MGLVPPEISVGAKLPLMSPTLAGAGVLFVGVVGVPAGAAVEAGLCVVGGDVVAPVVEVPTVVPAVVAGPAWAGDACVRFSAGAPAAEAAETGAARLGVPAPNWPVLAGEGLPDDVAEPVAEAAAAWAV